MRKLITFAAAGALALALGAPATSSATEDAFLKLEGIEETSPGSPPGCIDCIPPHAYFNGTAECTVCIPGKPTSGTVSISTVIATSRKSPCKIKRVSGTVEVSWNDGSVSAGELTGKLGGSRLKLVGAFYPNDPIYPSDPTKVLLNDFPSSPCLEATNAISGTMSITAR